MKGRLLKVYKPVLGNAGKSFSHGCLKLNSITTHDWTNKKKKKTMTAT